MNTRKPHGFGRYPAPAAQATDHAHDLTKEASTIRRVASREPFFRVAQSPIAAIEGDVRGDRRGAIHHDALSGDGHPQVLGALLRRFDRFDIAEDAVQEAFLAASQTWPTQGMPENPRSWLIRIGYRRMVDLLRSEGARHCRELEFGAAELAMHDPSRATPATPADDSLTLLLLCCHPALACQRR